MYKTNHFNVILHLLSRENLQQTIRLALLNAFENTDAFITEQLRELYEACLTLFESLLPPSEREEEREDDDSLLIQEDQDHYNAAVLHRLQLKHCRQVLDLSTRSSMLHQYSNLRIELREAYETNYDIESVYEFETQPII